MYCCNPACSSPENPDSNQFCQGCGLSLWQQPLFRGRYEVVKVLGQGAFGRTYLAKNKDRFDSLCVIKKFIAEAQGSKAKELFEQEGKSLYDLDHPQIPRLQAYFAQDNSIYLVQDYVEGENLLKELLKEGAFNEQKLLEFLRDFLPVLQYIHRQGLLHRDIRPENIMRRRSDGKIFLIDFGGVKHHLQTVSISGTVLYTAGYAPYEQVIGKPRCASDIYSLGATSIR
ncbi:MAG: protein kinase, partial [Spirulinaceae cyanobacterium]